MNPTANEQRQFTAILTRYQAEFVETALSPLSKRIVLLRAPVGTGKSTALVATASRLLVDKPNARILFLVPSALRWQFAYKLREIAVPSVVGDRYAFREMLDAASESTIWAAGMVSILSIDFAKQDDVLDVLERCSWDLLVVDEWHLIGRSQARAIKSIGRTATRILLASAPPFHDNLIDTYAQEGMTIVEWDLGRVLKASNERLGTMPPQVVHEIRYVLDDAEADLRKTVIELSGILEADANAGGWEKRTLIRCLNSSPAAIETALRRFVLRLTPMEDTEAESTFLDEVTSEVGSSKLSESQSREKLVSIAERALIQIETLDKDSKLKVFGATLSNIIQTNHSMRRIAVITDFVATLFYLAAEIEGNETPCRMLHGNMGVDERFRSVELFSRQGGILVATKAIISEGFDMRYVTDLVLYDSPQSVADLEQLLGRFNRIATTQRLDVYMLKRNDN